MAEIYYLGLRSVFLQVAYVFMIRIFSSALTFFCVHLSLNGQNSGNSQLSYGVGEKPVSEYYSSVDQKSHFQKHKIRNLKDELNNYSGRLHNLQKRFDEIFYGLSTKGKHSKPFDLDSMRANMNNQKRGYWYESNTSSYSSPKQNLFSADSTLGEPSTIEPESDFVAPTDQDETDFSGGKSGRFGSYLIVSPGASFPFKQHETVSGATPSLRKYVPGFSTNLATGFETNSYRIGLGAMYRINSHDGESYYGSDRLSESSSSLAYYLDLGYKTPLNENLDAYFGIGLGYYQTKSKIPMSLKDNGFYGTGSVGLSWNLSEIFAFRLGYRYSHDEEVPSHIGEVGLNFAF